MTVSGASLTDPFQLRRQRIGFLITALAIGAYALLSCLFLYRLVVDHAAARLSDVVFMLAGLTANVVNLIWLRQGHFARSAGSFMIANVVVVAAFSAVTSNDKALAGVVLALGVAIYASAALPRRVVTQGILFAFCSGALVAAMDYLRPWEQGRLNLTLTDPAIVILVALAVVFFVILARLYAGLPLDAKLLLPAAGTALFTSSAIFLSVYRVLRQMPPQDAAWTGAIEAAVVIAAAICVVACAVTARFFARTIIRPLQTLATASEKVSAEDWPGLRQPTVDGPTVQTQLNDLERGSQDEIADLARAFNRMASRLQETQAGLRQNVQELRQVSGALLESETTLRTFIDALPAPAFLLDQNGCFLATNRVIEADFRMGGQDMVGTYAFGLLRPALAASRKAYFDQVFQTGQLVQFEDTSRDRHFINYMCPVFDAAGYISRVAVFAFDITERKNAETVIQTQYDQLAAQNEKLQAQTANLLAQEQALSQAEAELRLLNAELEKRVDMRTAELAAANRELESFSHSISHDLRAPLRAIAGFTRVMDEDYRSQLDPTARHYLERIQSSVNHMSALIDNLLQLARLARAEPHRSAVNLSTLAHGVVDELRAADPARQVNFDCAPNLLVQADPHLIRTVLQNLLGNAWKFTAKHAAACIALGRTEVDGETVYFVRDDGAGFDMRYVSKLFGVFQRLHSREEFDGTGVGLASVQRILRRHGGRIWAEGAVEAGATFYFNLPEDTHAIGS